MRKSVIALAPLFALAISACEIRQTREGEPPELDVEPGTAPQFEVEPLDLDLRRDTLPPDVAGRDARQPADTLQR